MPAASFQPQTIDLSASFVQLIRTALANPKVTLDKTGLKSYDANGNLVTSINADGTAQISGALTAQGMTLAQGQQASSQIQWTRASDGAQIARAFAYDGGTSPHGAGQTRIEGYAPAGDEDGHIIAIFAYDRSGGSAGRGSAGMDFGVSSLAAQNRGKNFVRAQAFDDTGTGHSLTLLYEDGTSDVTQNSKNLSDLYNKSTARGNLRFTSPARAFRLGNLALPAGHTLVPLDTISFDPNGYISGGVYNVPVAGVYLAIGEVQMSSVANMLQGCSIWRNGQIATGYTGVEGNFQTSAAGGQTVYQQAIGMISCNAGDTLGLYAYSGAATNLTSGNIDFGNYLSVMQIG